MWVYFDVTNSVVSVIGITKDPVNHLNNISDAVWFIENHTVSWQKDSYYHKNEAHQYRSALSQFFLQQGELLDKL